MATLTRFAQLKNGAAGHHLAAMLDESSQNFFQR